MAGKALLALLSSYSSSALHQMLDGRMLKPGSARKNAALETLLADAARPASVARMLGLLSAEQSALLDIMLLYPGEVATHYIRRPALAAGVITPQPREVDYSYYLGYAASQTGDPASVHSTALADLVAGLSYRLLALASAGSGYAPTIQLGLSAQLTVPAEIRPALLDLRGPGVPTLAAPPGMAVATDARLVHRAFFLLWSALRDKPAGLTQLGLVRKTDARRLGQVLGVAEKGTEFDAEPDLAYLYFVRRMAVRLGLLVMTDGQLDAAGREPLREFLAESWPQRTLRLLRAWAGLEALQSALDMAAGAGRTEGRQFGAAGARAGYRRLFEVLATLPDAWVGLEAFITWMRRQHFGWLALALPSPLTIHDLGTELYHLAYGFRAEVDPWASYEGNALREGLRGALHWLGLVELAGAPGPEQAFRLTPAGRTLIAAFLAPPHAIDPLAPLRTTATAGRVVVQPNFQILAVGEVDEDTLFALGEIAELVRAEQVVEFKLTQTSVYGAQQAGWTPAAILDLLRRASGAPLAQNVERSILDWGAAHERIVIRRHATLLAAADAALLDRVAADPAAAALLGERPLPALALVRPGPAGPAAALAVLDSRLRALGELPATSDLAQDGPVPAFTFDAAGRVTWRTALPDLRPLGLLGGLTRRGPDGAPQLDERAVRATATTRRWQPADVLALLDTLAAWHAGPLPDPVVRQIKVWGGYQGRASLRRAILLQVARPELLAELQADPVLAPLLTPVAGSGLAAIVTPPAAAGGAPAPARGRRASQATEAPTPAADDLDAVRQALIAHGFTLDADTDPAAPGE